MSTEKKQSMLENVFEKILWNMRYCVLLAVFFSFISSVTLFLLGSVEVIEAVGYALAHYNQEGINIKVVGMVIGAIDLYLIGIVLLIFTFGVYELFISKIDVGRRNQEIKILEVTNLDQLKNRLLKVIIMVLIVAFFKQVLEAQYTTPLEMMYFALSIFAVSLGVYFLKKQGA